MNDTIDTIDPTDLTALTADIVSAYISKNNVRAEELAGLISSTHAALSGLGAPAPEPVADKPQGAVSIRKSLASPEAIVSMIDGKPYKMLRRHLSTNGYTPESYRAAFDLPKDYPMVAPAYAAIRGDLARKIGLGRKPSAVTAQEPASEPEAMVEEAAPAEPAPKRRRKLGISGKDALAKVRDEAQPAEESTQA